MTTTSHLVFENRTVKPQKPFKFGTLTEGRVDKAIDKIAAPYSKGAPSFLTLSPGGRIAISGQRDSHVTFVGMESGGLHYKAHSGHDLIRPLTRISFGLRFDIYSAGYWTRESVQATIPSSLVTDFKAEGVSRVQSAEIVVFDKRTGKVYPMWLSLGVNKDRILETNEPQATAYQRTQVLPPRSSPPVRTAQKTDLNPKTDREAPSTVCLLSIDEAARIATEVYRSRTLKSPITDAKMVLDSLVLNIAGQGVWVKREGESLRVKYSEDGRQRETSLSPETIKHDQSHYVNHGGSQYNVVFTVFNLKTRSKLEHSEALVFASIYTWNDKHYGTFVFGAA